MKQLDDFRNETRLAIGVVSDALALAAGRAVGDIAAKGNGRDIVTAMDVAVEDMMREALTRALNLPVIGEERGGTAADGQPHWLLDPICGTRNYASGVPLYCVNLALVERGRVTIAAVGDASHGEVLFAERGRGAWVWRGGRVHRLRASDASRTVIVEDSKSSGATRAHAAQFIAALVRADRWDLRSLGSSLSLAYVAAGRVAGYVVFLIGDVHAAAGSLLATEAGATLTDISGRSWTVASDTIVVAATAALHRELLELCRATAPS